MKTNAKINLSFDINASKTPKSVSSKQFDNLTRALTVRLGKEIPEESVVVLRGTKPDSTIFDLVGARLSEYEYLFEFTEGALSVSGRIVCDVNCTLFENGIAKTCSTEIFFIENMSSAVPANGIEDNTAKTIPLLIENALSDAKESGTFDGKTAYQYAVEGGFTGSEEDFSKKLAEDLSANGIPANAVKKTVLDSVVRIDDMIPEIQKIKGNIKSKNLLPIMPTKTVNGVLFTVFGDGKIVISGTASADTSFTIPLSLPADTYTFSMNNPYVFGGDAIRVVAYGKTGTPLCTVTPDTVNKTYTFKSESEIGMLSIRLSNGLELNDFIIKPQLEVGSVASPYTPMIESGNIACSVFGKNLLPPLKKSQTINGLTVIPNPDGTVYVYGSSENASVKIILDLALLDENGESQGAVLKAGKAYTLSVLKDGATYASYKNELYYPDTDETVFVSNLGDKTRERILKRVYLERTLPVGSTALDGVYSVQLELGSARSGHEVYSKEEYTSDENGFVEFLSVNPTMTVRTENEAAVVELTYSQDTNSALNDIKNALKALGADI